MVNVVRNDIIEVTIIKRGNRERESLIEPTPR